MTVRLRVALLGGAGLVGTELARSRSLEWDILRLDIAHHRLPEANVDDRVVEVLDEVALARSLSGVEAVVHLANVPVRSDPPYSAELLRDTFAVNVGSVYAAIRACAVSNVASFIHVSTMSVFSDHNPDDPLAEGDALGAYGFSKRLAERACWALSDLGPTVTSIRIAFPTPDVDWPKWRRPSDHELVPLKFNTQTYAALRVSDLARAIEVAASRRGGYLKVALAGDRRLAPTVDDVDGWLRETVQ